MRWLVATLHRAQLRHQLREVSSPYRHLTWTSVLPLGVFTRLMSLSQNKPVSSVTRALLGRVGVLGENHVWPQVQPLGSATPQGYVDKAGWSVG